MNAVVIQNYKNIFISLTGLELLLDLTDRFKNILKSQKTEDC